MVLLFFISLSPLRPCRVICCCLSLVVFVLQSFLCSAVTLIIFEACLGFSEFFICVVWFFGYHVLM